LNAKLAEIMESIQGEGLMVGSRNVFVRFAGCNLRCSYCDTPSSFEANPYCMISKSAQSDLWEKVSNPLSVSQVVEIIKSYSSKWISLTGGEPLLWAEFISEMGNVLKAQGYQLLLETNGTLYDQLEICLPYVDLISMDFKMPSATGEDNWTEHTEFLKRAGSKPVYIKIVIDKLVNPKEVKDAIGIIASVNRNIPLILQPATPVGAIVSPDISTLLDLQKICLEEIRDVRIIPQLHKLMGLM